MSKEKPQITKKSFSLEFQELLNKANIGDAEAQFKVGHAYKYGNIKLKVKCDLKKISPIFPKSC